jgi:type III pantothenate kinase
LCLFAANKKTMLLALDIGNTNIVAGLFDGGELSQEWRVSTAPRTADEFAVFFKVAFDAHDLHFLDVKGVAISSVVPSLTPQAVALARQYFQVEPMVVGHDTETGLTNEYDDPRAVGADRLVNARAAWSKFGCACVIADFGTATTVDAVSGDGAYLGGAIAPGLQISTDALFAAAARLPRVELAPPPEGKALGRHTSASMQAGLVYGYAGLTRELVRRARQEVLEREEKAGRSGVCVVATGGLSELIAPLVSEIDAIEPALTLQGLHIIWNNIHES